MNLRNLALGLTCSIEYMHAREMLEEEEKL